MCEQAMCNGNDDGDMTTMPLIANHNLQATEQLLTLTLKHCTWFLMCIWG